MRPDADVRVNLPRLSQYAMLLGQLGVLLLGSVVGTGVSSGIGLNTATERLARIEAGQKHFGETLATVAASTGRHGTELTDLKVAVGSLQESMADSAANRRESDEAYFRMLAELDEIRRRLTTLEQLPPPIR